MWRPSSGAGRRPDFLKLWAGQSVSLFGSAVTGLAFPLTAVLVLDATPTQMGVVAAAEYLPFLLLGLVAGVWVDRRRRLPILVGADVGRALLLAAVPAAAALGLLRLELLYAVAFLVGVLTVAFDVAYLAYVPALVSRDALADANAKLEVSRSAAQVGGPALAGALVQAVTAPVALAVDAASFAVSAAALGLIRTPEPDPGPGVAPAAGAAARRSVWEDLAEGLRAVGGHSVLRALAGQIATLQLAGGINTTLLVLYATRELGLAPAFLGALTAVFGAVALATALVQGRLAPRLDRRRALIGSLLLIGLGNVCVPVTGVWPGAAGPLLVTRMVLHGLAAPVFNAASVGLRQAVTPDRLQGRVSATIRFVGWGLLPVSALLGGVLAERVGVLPTLTVAVALSLSACLWPLLQMPRVIVPLESGAPASPAPAGA